MYFFWQNCWLKTHFRGVKSQITNHKSQNQQSATNSEPIPQLENRLNVVLHAPKAPIRYGFIISIFVINFVSSIRAAIAKLQLAPRKNRTIFYLLI